MQDRAPHHNGAPLPCRLALSLVMATGALHAQSYTLDWHSLDGGGGTSSGGSYVLSGSLGQPDVGVAIGDGFRLEGGFWPGVLVPSVAVAPTLSIQRTTGGFWIEWTPQLTGFVLEQAEALTGENWRPAPTGNPVLVPLEGAVRFYRVKKP